MFLSFKYFKQFGHQTRIYTFIICIIGKMFKTKDKFYNSHIIQPYTSQQLIWRLLLLFDSVISTQIFDWNCISISQVCKLNQKQWNKSKFMKYNSFHVMPGFFYDIFNSKFCFQFYSVPAHTESNFSKGCKPESTLKV